MTSPDLCAANVDKIAELFPGVVTESRDDAGKITRKLDFDLLRQELSDHVVDGPQERYHLDWPGKRAALFAANAPIAKTLRPMRDESVDFDTTKNLFIEGDNLDALKLLQESYLGKVKLIYIDPPYNTGRDFIYNDDFAETTADYLARSGQTDEDGARLVANPESNGRYHSDWLSMMYPRLKLARNLLRDDGAIVVSIDDAEFAGLTQLLDQVFGVNNRLGVLVWDRNRKNDARYLSVGHEYMVVYTRDRATLDEANTRLREPQPGIGDAREFFAQVTVDCESDWDSVRDAWRNYCKQFPADDERRKLGRFSKVGPRGPYRDDGNISWPGGGGPSYEVLHPENGKPCKVPEGGWRYPTRSSFDRAVAQGKVVFGPDETTLPRQIRYLFESPGLVMRSVHFSYAQTAAVEFQELMEGRVFDNPKNWRDLRRIFEYLTDPGDLILDFFAGSGSSAHAVVGMDVAESHESRRFILVQLAETIPAKSVDAHQRYRSIADLSRDRIKRAAAQSAGVGADIGFRALRVDSTNMADVRLTPDDTRQESLTGLESSVKPGRSGEDLLFQVLLDWGLELSLPITTEQVDAHTIYLVDDGALAACFDDDITPGVVRAIAQHRPERAVFRDSGFSSDAERINVEQVFRELSPSTDIKTV